MRCYQHQPGEDLVYVEGLLQVSGGEVAQLLGREKGLFHRGYRGLRELLSIQVGHDAARDLKQKQGHEREIILISVVTWMA